MEGELWPVLYDLARQEAARKSPTRRVVYSDLIILLVLLWAALHDRPVCWACDAAHWPADWQWLTLPSPATVSRRSRTLSLRLLLTALIEALAAVTAPPPLCPCRALDSKPLTVGGFSKDRDARRGYAAGVIGRGYKLCAAWDPDRPVPQAWRLGPLNWADSDAAAAEVDDLSRGPHPGGYLLADTLHDHGDLHRRCRAAGFQLVAPRAKPGTGLRHARAGDRSHDPGRLRSIELTEPPPVHGLGAFGRALYAQRRQIERRFGNLCSFGGGLAPLPAWVRRPHRVALWVALKLVINGVRACRIKGLAA